MTTRATLTFLMLSAVICLPGIAQSNGTCALPPSMPLKAGDTLVVEGRPAEITVVGAQRENIHVSCELNPREAAEKIKILYTNASGLNRLHFKGGPRNNVRIRIEVPQRTNLKLRAAAGEWKVSGVSGDKDLQVRFGEIWVSPVTTQEYKSVEASVRVGEVDVPGNGVTKKEFLSSFGKGDSSGKYQLRTHVMTGEIHLE